jgi:hypothetical protein
VIEKIGESSARRQLQPLLTTLEYVFQDAEEKDANPHALLRIRESRGKRLVPSRGFLKASAHGHDNADLRINRDFSEVKVAETYFAAIENL